MLSSTWLQIAVCTIITCMVLINNDIILLVLMLIVVALSMRDMWWHQEIQRNNRCSDKWSIVLQPDCKTVSAGSSLTIICNIYNLPDDTTTTNISWFVKRNGNSQATRLSVESEKYSVRQSEKPTLTIHEFSLEDEGIYICEVENDVGLKKSGSSNLQFIEKPRLKGEPKQKDCIKASANTIVCSFEGSEPTHTNFLKVSKGIVEEIDVSSEKYEVNAAGKLSLCVSNFVQDDEGTYVCFAANQAGIASSNGMYLSYILNQDDYQNLEDNFHRLVAFVVKIAGDVSRKYFEFCILKSDTFEIYLGKHIHEILHLHEGHPCCNCKQNCMSCPNYKKKAVVKGFSNVCKCNPVLTEKQILELFTYDRSSFVHKHVNPKGKPKQRCVCAYKVKSSISLNSVDITLLCSIIKTIEEANVHRGIDKKYEEIRDTRNYIFHQSDSLSISNHSFEKKWKILKDSTEYMFQYITDKQFKENIIKQINEIRGTVRISNDNLAQKQICEDYWKDKCAELEKRQQEEFSQILLRFQEVLQPLDEDTNEERAETVTDEIDALQTFVNKVNICVNGNVELKNLLTCEYIEASEDGKKTIPFLLQMEVPEQWDQKDIQQTFGEIQRNQANEDTEMKIKNYSIVDLSIIIDTVKSIMRKEHKLNHVLTSLISRLLLNINTEKEEKILLTMIAPEKLKLEIQPETKKVIKGHIQRIECKIIGKPSSNNVWWTRKTKEQNIERNIDTTQEGYSGGTVDCASLTIFGFKETDAGIYICRSTNEAGEGLSNESILQYIEPPTLKVYPDEQHVVKGTDQRLDCSISGIPKPVITWMKGDIKIDLTIDQYKYSGGTDESPSLIIKSFEISDEGMYVCKAVNEAGEGTSNQSHLTFIAPPTVKVSSNTQDVVKGEDHTLNSDIFGIPKPVITWMKLVNGEYKILDLLKEKYFGGTCDCPSLTIKLFNTNDDGIYVCKATNIAGEQTSNATCLTCIELPTVRITPDKENVIKGKTQTLKCVVSGIPKPQISWKREISGEETIIDLSLDKYVQEYGDYPSLTIIGFTVIDEGRYFCTATNKVGEAISNNSFLKYFEKPEILIKPKAKRVTKGYSQTIVCCMSGTPIPKIITWTRKLNEGEIPVDLTSDKYSGGTVDCPSLTINNFNEADDGNYRCRATNEAGEGLSNLAYFATKFSVDD